ncbi:MAG: ThiF family adenylyltransferase [Nitrospirota bacterium]|nr:ThiF family adenylyltransferase [Nitrospirota bacterium]
MTLSLSGSRIARQMTLPGWSDSHQGRLEESRVFLAGIGGVGGVIAEYLVMGGVRDLVLVHEGPLCLSDLNRQTLMHHDGIGTSRVLLASQRLRSLVPDCRIESIDGKVSEAHSALVSSCGLVIDARTNFEERFLLNRLAARGSRPLIFAAMNGMEGVVAHLRPGRSACLECVFPEGDPEWDPLGFPVLGAISGTVGAMAAVLALRVLSGFGAESENRMTVFEGMDLSTRSFGLSRNRACPVCRDLKL